MPIPAGDRVQFSDHHATRGWDDVRTDYRRGHVAEPVHSAECNQGFGFALIQIGGCPGRLGAPYALHIETVEGPVESEEILSKSPEICDFTGGEHERVGSNAPAVCRVIRRSERQSHRRMDRQRRGLLESEVSRTVEQRRRAESESTGSERFCVSVNDVCPRGGQASAASRKRGLWFEVDQIVTRPLAPVQGWRDVFLGTNSQWLGGGEKTRMQFLPAAFAR